MTDDRPVLAAVVNSEAYPLPAGSAPDRLVRQLVELIPNWPAECSTPDSDPLTATICVELHAPDGSGGGVAIEINLPGAIGRGAPEWLVTCVSEVTVELPLSFAAGPAVIASVIRVLHRLEVLPTPTERIPANC